MFWGRAPFIICPHCSNETFGVFQIFPDTFTRRCNTCDFPRVVGAKATYWLPRLTKKLIYLDQSALSNFMKALNPKANRMGKVDAKWKDLFSEIDSLVKLQRVVCPDSEIHRSESIVFQYGEDVKRVYELLSHGHTFFNKDRIWFNELLNLFRAFSAGIPYAEVETNLSNAISEDVHGWQEKIILSVSLSTSPAWIKMHLDNKKDTHERLKTLFEFWTNQPRKKFDHWFKIELAESNKIAQQRFKERLYLFALDEKKSKDEARKLVEDFFASEYPHHAPSIRVDCALFAILAYKASHGMKKLKDEGVMNDFASLSLTLPYCDAVLIDRQTAGFLREIPKGILNYKSVVYSNAELSELHEFLSVVRSEIDDEHMKYIREVYGENQGKPFLSLFENESVE